MPSRAGLASGEIPASRHVGRRHAASRRSHSSAELLEGRGVATSSTPRRSTLHRQQPAPGEDHHGGLRHPVASRDRRQVLVAPPMLRRRRDHTRPSTRFCNSRVRRRSSASRADQRLSRFVRGIGPVSNDTARHAKASPAGRPASGRDRVEDLPGGLILGTPPHLHLAQVERAPEPALRPRPPPSTAPLPPSRRRFHDRGLRSPRGGSQLGQDPRPRRSSAGGAGVPRQQVDRAGHVAAGERAQAGGTQGDAARWRRPAAPTLRVPCRLFQVVTEDLHLGRVNEAASSQTA